MGVCASVERRYYLPYFPPSLLGVGQRCANHSFLLCWVSISFGFFWLRGVQYSRSIGSCREVRWSHSISLLSCNRYVYRHQRTRPARRRRRRQLPRIRHHHPPPPRRRRSAASDGPHTPRLVLNPDLETQPQHQSVQTPPPPLPRHNNPPQAPAPPARAPPRAPAAAVLAEPPALPAHAESPRDPRPISPPRRPPAPRITGADRGARSPGLAVCEAVGGGGAGGSGVLGRGWGREGEGFEVLWDG